MKNKILARYPLGNPRRIWRQDNFVLSTFSAKGENMRGILEVCADAGYTMVEIGWASHKQAEEALRLCEELGLELVYQDLSLYGGMQMHRMDREPLNAVDIKAICDHVRPYKRTVGYYIWDEPLLDNQLLEARRQVDMFEHEDPTRCPFTVAIPSYNDEMDWKNGLFEGYLNRYCSVIDPPMLSLDYYPIGLPGYTKESQLDNSYMWLDIGLMRMLGRKYHMPLWFYYHGKNYKNYDRFTFPMVRMNMYAATLYGVKGLQQFTAVGATVTEQGEPDVFFEDQKKIHREFKKLGNTLMALESINVIHSDDLLPSCENLKKLAETMADSRHLSGKLPKRISVGEFEDAYGNQYLMILNRDYETDVSITLDLKNNSRIYEVSRITGKQSVVWDKTEKISLTLEKGDAILYRLQPASEEAFTVEYRLEK